MGPKAMTTRQQRRAAQRASAMPRAATASSDLLDCVAILEAFDPLKLHLARTMLIAMIDKPNGEIVDRIAAGQRGGHDADL
jgi:hypothetical protein